ncbi:TonB family protein [Hyphococcus sp. DH-69]|uniref:energy transducer TonB n=1 Tax=Hyphococcus formosus TaxID=3143534 RepID=UPI00398B843D
MLLFRWIFGLPVAAFVTTALFFMMAQLIKDRGEPLPDAKPNLEINIFAKEPGPEGKDPIREPRPLPDTEPPIILDLANKPSRPDGTRATPRPQSKKTKIPIETGSFQSATIRTTPLYPEGCRSRGASGIVIVEFDVTPDGNVANARVIETPDRCFVRPVLRAVSGWKYPPRSGGGMRYGIVEQFNFQLVD